MARKADDIRQDIKGTRQDIHDTRLAMTEKLEMMEERARQTIEGVQSSVEDIVQKVKGTVDTTVEGVKRNFDLRYQVDRHPWLVFGGSLVVGYMLGSRRGGRMSSSFSTNGAAFSLKIIVVGAVMSTLREMLKRALLAPAAQVNNAMTKPGRQPIDRPEQNPAPISSSKVKGQPIRIEP
jgi:hypothetical protein